MGDDAVPRVPEAAAAEDEWEEDIEFDCPRCGSDCFTTHFKDIHDLRLGSTGECRDREGEHGCGYTWDRKDDWKHFVLIRKRHFKSEQEYYDETGYER
jgi:hypothetical protein